MASNKEFTDFQRTEPFSPSLTNATEREHGQRGNKIHSKERTRTLPVEEDSHQLRDVSGIMLTDQQGRTRDTLPTREAEQLQAGSERTRSSQGAQETTSTETSGFTSPECGQELG